MEESMPATRCQCIWIRWWISHQMHSYLMAGTYSSINIYRCRPTSSAVSWSSLL